MRNFGIGLVLAASAALFACSEPQHRPATSPEPQRAINAPSIQEPSPMAGQHQPQQPVTEPQPQQPLTHHQPQQPITSPEPQKPFYGGATAGEERQAKTEKPLSDAEVLSVAETAHKGEIQMADIALKKGSSPEVKQFANMMKNMHQQGLDSGKKLAQKANLSPAESDATTTLKTETEKTVTELKDKKGKDFDRTYMDAQVKAHKDVLEMIDNRLLPSAQNADVKAMVSTMRTQVAEHLTKAEDSLKKIETGGAAKAKTGTEKKGKTEKKEKR